MVVRVLSLNVFTPVLGADQKESRLSQLIAFLKENQFDVLLLQEVFQFSVLGKEMFGFRNWLKEQLKPLGFHHFLFSPTPLLGQNSGLFLASRHALEGGQGANYGGWGAWSGIEAWTWKGYLIADVKIENSPPLSLCVTHLQCGSGKNWREAQRQQLTQLRRALGEKNDVILGGDFNIDALGNDGNPEQFAFLKKTLSPLVDPLDNPQIPQEQLISCGNDRLDYLMIFNPNKWGVVENSARVFAIGEGIEMTGMSDHKAVEVSFGFAKN